METLQAQTGKIFVRTDIFNHGIFPAPTKLTMLNLNSFFGDLGRSAEKDSSITLASFALSLTKFFPKLTPEDAEIYFIYFKAITDPDLSFLEKLSEETAVKERIKFTR